MRFSVRHLAIAGTACLVTAAAAAQDWSIDWYSIDGGGVRESAGEEWTVSGTIGQWDASESASAAGAEWEISSGFWSQAAPQTDWVFADGFEE